MRLPPNDYLKYWRVIRYFIKAKYKINTGELDVLLFLYSEKYFSKDKFNEFDELISWDVNRFNKLLRDGWVVVFRKRQGKKKALYEVSYKGRRMLGSMYKKLSGEEIPESPSVNPMFLKNVSYTDKVYRNMIIEMNKFIRQQRHPSP
mgnify:FL=1|jgi:hypothetical protein